MLRSFLASLALLILTIPSLLFAADDLAILESVVAARQRAQPELQNYLASIETSLIEWADSVELVREASKPFIGW